MACKRAATCRARFARGEQACVRCAEGKLDIGDVEDLDVEDLDEGGIDDVDDVDDDDDIDGLENGEEHDDADDEEYAYTTQPDGKFGDLARDIEVCGETVRGLRVTVTEPNLGDVDYVIAALDAHDDLPVDVCNDVDYFAEDGEMLYDILAAFVDYDVKQK